MSEVDFVNYCCFCGEECNISSQACGYCVRSVSPKTLKPTVNDVETNKDNKEPDNMYSNRSVNTSYSE